MTCRECLPPGMRPVYDRFPEPAAFGFECGPGWYDLIVELDRQIAELVPEYRLFQVKEKFGGLRYYVGPIPGGRFDRVFELVDEAEAKSFSICECCGEPGRTGTRGYWMSTRCADCAPDGWVVDTETDCSDEPEERTS